MTTATLLADFAAPPLPPVSLAWGDGRAHTWALDLPAIERAARGLALTRPVRVGLTNGRGGRRKLGMHRVQHGAHVITIVRGQPAQEASATVWHELEHARQADVDFAADDARFGRAYHAEPGVYEQQARDREREALRRPLVRS